MGRARGHVTADAPTYSVWVSMIQRCKRRHHAEYYSGRGITVCERWRTYANFVADMGPQPKGLTLDRWPDNDGNYEPGNCRWATWSQQQQNSRRTINSKRIRD